MSGATSGQAARHVLVMTRYPAQDATLEIDGEPRHIARLKVTPDITTIVWDEPDAAAEPQPAPELAALRAERDGLAELVRRYERITTSWTRGMYAARIDCQRGDVKAAIGCLSEGLDGYDGTEWNGTETGAEWWERTKAEDGL